MQIILNVHATTISRRMDWSREVVWCNPPFGSIEPWVRKAYEESLRGATVVMLLPCRTDTAWWHDWIVPYAEKRWTRGRIKFIGMDDKVPFATAIFIFRPPKPRSRGGYAAASRMSAEARRQRAKTAAAARWSKSRATEKNPRLDVFPAAVSHQW
jgi:DNA N-6-adenine-methyltransferase (Dam)